MPLSQIESASLNAALVAPTATALSTASGSAPSYSARAWVNFNGAANSNILGTYSQTGTAITVTATNHGLLAGQSVYLTFQSGTAGAELCIVASVSSSSVFVATSVTSRTTSGNCTLNFQTIRASGNVSSVTDNGTGDYTINFTVAMPDANYAAISTAGDSGALVPRVSGPTSATAPTVSAYRLVAALGSTSAAQDVSYVFIAFFR